ncbi:MAG: response regulator [Candidatus Falkowbacteria bacterium]|nr:response regulator [Candidatus Falkowbacteria bacterium]
MSKKILIIEDDLILAKALRASLEEEKFEVSEAHDGFEGLAAAEKNLPDLILCDISMPKMDGLTMLATMRDTAWGKNLSVIMLTNFSDEEKISVALKHSVFRYLVKSDWDLSQIIAEIKKEFNS